MMVGGKSWPDTDGVAVNMVNTFRRPQRLNGRTVTRTHFAGEDSSILGGGNQLSSKVFLQSSAFCLVAAAAGKLLQ